VTTAALLVGGGEGARCDLVQSTSSIPILLKRRMQRGTGINTSLGLIDYFKGLKIDSTWM
jgi:hypothetical protein